MNEIKVYCLHQVFRQDGNSNCRECIPDEYNWNCAGYFPVSMVIFEVRQEAEHDAEH